MYDGGKITFGLLIFVILITLPFTLSIGKEYIKANPKIDTPEIMKLPEAERKCMNRAIKAAKAALSGENNIGDFLYFRLNNSKAANIKKKYEYKIIGDHIFYRMK